MSTVFSEQPDAPDLPGDMDLEERHALRRVAGLSTELQDISEVEYRALRLERVVLIGVWAEGSLASAENSLRELSRLAETAGSEVLDGLIQRRSGVDAATYIGSGKAHELAGIVAAAGADTVICDGELTPSQLRRLESVVQVKVIDRTALILDIFAQHARSREGKAQVELAQLQYMLPRLRGWGESLSRQAGGRVAGGGGIGTRGPGETKLETDRRRLRARVPGSVSVSAKTGAGLAALREAIEAALPRLDAQVRLIVPYDRGDLVARAHADGEVLRAEHGSDGTLLEARVPPGLAAQLEAAAPAPAAP